MLRSVNLFVPLLVVAAASLRLLANSVSPVHFPDAISLDAIQSADVKNHPNSSPLITRIEYQRFDPTAVVAILPGADLRPGRAGSDDNFNGVVDDRLELGATHSDDVCQVVTADRLNSIPTDQVLVMQRGAFVTLPNGHPTLAQRQIEFHQSLDRQVWSVLVDRVNQ